MSHNFDLSVNTDHRTGEILAVYFQVRRGRSAEVREYAQGRAFADYDNNGNLLGIELLAPCQVELLEEITKQDPQATQFVRNAAPREMVPAA